MGWLYYEDGWRATGTPCAHTLQAVPSATHMQLRYTVQQHEQTHQAIQLKVRLLEEQVASTAESARRRMEEQLHTFRGDAATAR